MSTIQLMLRHHLSDIIAGNKKRLSVLYAREYVVTLNGVLPDRIMMVLPARGKWFEGATEWVPQFEIEHPSADDYAKSKHHRNSRPNSFFGPSLPCVASMIFDGINNSTEFIPKKCDSYAKLGLFSAGNKFKFRIKKSKQQ